MEIVTVLAIAPAVAVIVAGCVVAIVPAMAVNTADILPAGTTTEAGTHTSGVFEDNETATEVVAFPVRDTVQTAVLPERSNPGPHVTENNCGGACSISAYFAVAAPSVTAIVVPVLALTAAATAVNCAEAAPAGTVRDGGTATAGLSEEIVRDMPPAGAGPESDTVHMVDAGVMNDLGAQDSAFSSVNVPPAAAVITGWPFDELAVTLLKLIGTLDGAVPASWTLTFASTPVPMTVELIPVARHVTLLSPL